MPRNILFSQRSLFKNTITQGKINIMRLEDDANKGLLKGLDQFLS